MLCGSKPSRRCQEEVDESCCGPPNHHGQPLSKVLIRLVTEANKANTSQCLHAGNEVLHWFLQTATETDAMMLTRAKRMMKSL